MQLPEKRVATFNPKLAEKQMLEIRKQVEVVFLSDGEIKKMLSHRF